MSANAAFALAELELEIYSSKKGSGKPLDDNSLDGIEEEELWDSDDEVDNSNRSGGKAIGSLSNHSMGGLSNHSVGGMSNHSVGGLSNHSKDRGSHSPLSPKPKGLGGPLSPKPKGGGKSLRNMFRLGGREEVSFGEEDVKKETKVIIREEQKSLPRERERSPVGHRAPRERELRANSPKRERSPMRPSGPDRRRMFSATHGSKDAPRRNFSEWEKMQD